MIDMITVFLFNLTIQFPNLLMHLSIIKCFVPLLQTTTIFCCLFSCLFTRKFCIKFLYHCSLLPFNPIMYLLSHVRLHSLILNTPISVAYCLACVLLNRLCIDPLLAVSFFPVGSCIFNQ